MGISAVHALRSHPPRNRTSISSKTCNGDSHMVINWENLLLMRGEVTGSSFEGNQDCVGVGFQANCGGTLLHCLHGILNLMKSTLWAPDCHITVILISEHLG